MEIWIPTWKTAIISISSTGAFNLINILVPRFFGLKIGGSYLFTVKILQIINEFSYAPFYSRLPNFISQYKQGFNLSSRNSLIKRYFISLTILIVGTSLLIFFGNYFIELIETDTDLMGSLIISFFLIYYIFERSSGMFSQIIMFSNDIEHYKSYIFSSILFLLLFFSLFKFGLFIIPFSGAFCYLILNILLFSKTKRNLKVIN